MCGHICNQMIDTANTQKSGAASEAPLKLKDNSGFSALLMHIKK